MEDLVEAYLVSLGLAPDYDRSYGSMVIDDYPRVAVSMLRGSGKSTLLITRVLRFMCNHPRQNVLILTPSHNGGRNLIEILARQCAHSNITIQNVRSLSSSELRLDFGHFSSYIYILSPQELYREIIVSGLSYSAVFIDDAESVSRVGGNYYMDPVDVMRTSGYNFVIGTPRSSNASDTVLEYALRYKGWHTYDFSYVDVPGIRSVSISSQPVMGISTSSIGTLRYTYPSVEPMIDIEWSDGDIMTGDLSVGRGLDGILYRPR
jgi:hypothetical protein